MWIEKRRQKNRNDFLFIFCFSSVEDSENFIQILTTCADGIINEDIRTSYLSIVNKINDRCDNMYAHDDCVCSAMLFSDEFVSLVENSIFALATLSAIIETKDYIESRK
jgi:hypothetical protein